VIQSADYSRHPERETGGARRRGGGGGGGGGAARRARPPAGGAGGGGGGPPPAARPCCVTRSPESQPCGLRAGRGGPTPPERTPPPAATRPVTRAAFVNNQPRYPHRFARKPMETGAQRRDVAIRAWFAANECHQGSRRQARLRLAWSDSDGKSYRGGAAASRCFGWGGMIQPARGSKSFSRKRLQRKGVRSKSAERPCRSRRRGCRR